MATKEHDPPTLTFRDARKSLAFYRDTMSMPSCPSCGMPMKDAKPGKLRPFQQILEGTTTGYFMAMQKMPREKAEMAAREHLAKMPAWHGRV